MKRYSFYTTNSMEKSPSSEAFYGILKFITAFTRACHLALSWAR